MVVVQLMAAESVLMSLRLPPPSRTLQERGRKTLNGCEQRTIATEVFGHYLAAYDMETGGLFGQFTQRKTCHS